MTRFRKRCGRFPLAATLPLFLVAVLVAHVDDYRAPARAALTSGDAAALSEDSPTDLRATPPGPQSDQEHECSCLLCTATVSDSPRDRVLRPLGGTLAATAGGAVAGSLDLPQVFHPPSA